MSMVPLRVPEMRDAEPGHGCSCVAAMTQNPRQSLPHLPLRCHGPKPEPGCGLRADELRQGRSGGGRWGRGRARRLEPPPDVGNLPRTGAGRAPGAARGAGRAGWRGAAPGLPPRRGPQQVGAAEGGRLPQHRPAGRAEGREAGPRRTKGRVRPAEEGGGTLRSTWPRRGPSGRGCLRSARQRARPSRGPGDGAGRGGRPAARPGAVRGGSGSLSGRFVGEAADPRQGRATGAAGPHVAARKPLPPAPGAVRCPQRQRGRRALLAAPRPAPRRGRPFILPRVSPALRRGRRGGGGRRAQMEWRSPSLAEFRNAISIPGGG